MYNPQQYRSQDINEAFDVMDQNPFATLIAVVEGQPIVSHLPLTPKRVGDRIELIGHMAGANPQWKYFVDTKITVIFHGPHAYITPQWYAENDVPTWNYIVVHTFGRVELIESHEGLLDCLKELTAHVERHWTSGWDFYIPNDLTGDILSKSIVGFKVKIDDIQFKKKLSQNRCAKDRSGILQGLATRSDDNSRGILSAMRKIFSSNGEVK